MIKLKKFVPKKIKQVVRIFFPLKADKNPERRLNSALLKENDRFSDLTDKEVKTIASFLLQLARERKGQINYLEIGVFGGGTIKFLKSILGNKVKFHGVDLFEDFISDDKNTHVSGTFLMSDVQDYVGDDVVLIKGDSRQILPSLMPEMFNFIFIDGNHTYDATLTDFNNSIKFLAPGGFIAFHNCSSWSYPDFDLYNVVDGGPWLVTQELFVGNKWRLVSEVDRLRIFSKIIS